MTDCYFCDMKKSNDNINKDLLFQFMTYSAGKGKNLFRCTLCKFSIDKRASMQMHIRSIHKSDINANMNPKNEEKSDCGTETCKELYGVTVDIQKFWCKKCISDYQSVRKRKGRPKSSLEKAPKTKLCPECGESVKNLSTHLEDVHYGEKQNCPQCGKELRSAISLKGHINRVHEKIPCQECGVLVHSDRMKRHMMATHTPDHLKRFQCELCPKGFATRDNLSDHINVHTGEKPYKCKFCSATFASIGTHGGHVRTHLGIKRNK